MTKSQETCFSIVRLQKRPHMIRQNTFIVQEDILYNLGSCETLELV